MPRTVSQIDFMVPNEQQLVVDLVVPGEPESKARARYARKTGRFYTPDKTKNAEEAIGWLIKQAQPGIQPNKHDSFGVEVQFFCKTYHRRDLDNMTKLVMDACNNLVWHDDSQVERLTAQVIRASEIQETRIRIYSFPSGIPYKECEVCQKPIRLHPSWGARKYCSRKCSGVAQQQRVDITCGFCGTVLSRLRGSLERGANYCNHKCKSMATTRLIACGGCGIEFRRPKSWIKGQVQYCTRACMDQFLAKRKRERGGVCQECGSPKSKPEYERCKRCSVEPRGDNGKFVNTRAVEITSLANP